MTKSRTKLFFFDKNYFVLGQRDENVLKYDGQVLSAESLRLCSSAYVCLSSCILLIFHSWHSSKITAVHMDYHSYVTLQCSRQGMYLISYFSEET